MKKFHTSFMALPLLCAAAIMPAVAHADGDHKDAAAWHSEMCTDHYAHEFGHLAYLQAKLGLTAEEQPLWDKFQQAKLDAATKHRDECLQMTPKGDKRPTVLEREDRAEKMLTATLDELHAVRQPLEALYNGLTSDQKAIVDKEVAHHHGWGQEGEHGQMGPGQMDHDSMDHGPMDHDGHGPEHDGK